MADNYSKETFAMTAKQDHFILSLTKARWQGLGFASQDEAVAQMTQALHIIDAEHGGDWKPKSELIDQLKGMDPDPDPTMPEALVGWRKVGVNDSPGRCDSCGHTVEAREGFYFGPHGQGRKWRMHHKVGECSTEPIPAEVKLEDGFYLVGAADDPESVMYQLYTTRNGRQAGKVWEAGQFQYQPGVASKVTAAHKVTEEEVAAWTCLKEFGALPGSEELRAIAATFGYEEGHCMFCHRDLTDPRSDPNQGGAGYGPVCAAKYNLPWG